MSKTDLYTMMGPEYNRAYFQGLKGLQPQTRDAFVQKYSNLLAGKTEEEQDEEFRKIILGSHLSKSANPELAKLWKNQAKELDTPEKRNKIFAQLALTSDLDSGDSDVADSSTDITDWFQSILGHLAESKAYGRGSVSMAQSAGRWAENSLVDKKMKLDETTTVRNQARDYLEAQSSKYYHEFATDYQRQSEAIKRGTRQSMIEYSAAISPNYFQRFNHTLTDPGPMLDSLYVKYNAWHKAGGQVYADEKLANFWQDYFASQQTQGEKWANATVKFGQDIASTAIMAAGIVKGLLGNPGEQTEGYWRGVIDNEWTKYGADLFTTGQWSKAMQEVYKEKGWDKNQILNTVEQERSLVSWNTPAELFGQYGFTAASMLLSGGYSGIAKGATMGAVRLGIKSGLKATRAGQTMLRGVLRAGRIAQKTVPFAVAMPEATLEALTTRDDILRTAENKIDLHINQSIDKDIFDYINTNPDAAFQYIRSNKELADYTSLIGTASYNQNSRKLTRNYSDLDIQRMHALLSKNQAFRQQFEKRYAGFKEAQMQQYKDSEDTVLWTTFGLNMAILGGVNSTLQVTQQALGVRNALGAAGKRRFANAVDLVQNGNTWKALAKNVTKGQIFKDRFKEAIGEGAEEIGQGLISAFSEGMIDNKVKQYFDYRYNSKGSLDAFTEDTWQMVGAGLMNGGKKLISKDLFKEGLYGFLSTLLGGPSVNFNMSVGGRRENENVYDAVKRNLPIAWRGISETIFSSAEQKARQNENQQIADTFNAYFSDPAKQELLFNIVGNMSAHRAFNTYINNDQEREARDSKVDILFNTVAMLNALRGTSYYDTTVKMLTERTRFSYQNLDDMESNEAIAVEEYRLETGSTEHSETILRNIKESAQTLLDTIENADKEIESIRTIYGDGVSLDVQNSMVNNRLHIRDTDRRKKLLTEELNAIDFSEEGGVTPRSPHSKKIKQWYARYGNANQAQAAQQNLKQQLTDTQAQLQQVEENLADQEEGVIEQFTAPLKHDITATEQKIADLEEYLSELQKNEITDDIVLNMQDIAELDSESRFALLHAAKYIPKGADGKAYTRVLSNRQAREIEKFKKRGQKADSKFIKKLQDLYALEQANSLYTSLDFSLMSKPKLMLQYSAYVRKKAQQDISNKKYEYLSDNESEANTSYMGFKQAYLDATRDATSEEELESIKVNGRNSQHWQRFSQEQKEFEELTGKIARTKSYSNLTKKQQQDINSVLMLLFREGVSYKGVGTIYNHIMELKSVLSSEAIQAQIFDRIQADKLPISKHFDANFVLDTILSSLHDIKKAQEEMDSRPTAKPTDSATGTSPIEVIEAVPATTSTVSDDRTINVVLRNLREQFKSYPKVLSGLDKVEPIVAQFGNDTLQEDLNNAIQNAESTEIKDALMFIRARLLMPTEVTSSSSTVMSTPKSTSGQIESFNTSDLAEMKEFFGGEEMRAALTRIYDYTSSPEGYAQMRQYHKKRKALKFYIPEKVEAETRQAYGENYVPSLHAPVVILMPHESGEVLIEGKKYKEIGFLPATTNPTKSGAVRTEVIRRSLLNKDGTIKTNTISPVQTTSWKIPGKAPQHLDRQSKNTNVKEVIEQTSSMDITSFARAMAVAKPKTENGSPTLTISIPNFKGEGTTTPMTVFVTPARDVRDEDGKNFFDYLIDGNEEKALSFNWRIREVASTLKEILGDNRYLEATPEQLEILSKNLNSTINKYIRFSGKTSKFKIENYTSEDGAVHSKLLLDLGSTAAIELQNNIDEVTTENSDQAIFNILKTVFLNNDQTEERKLSSTGQYLIYQVDYQMFEEQDKEIPAGDGNIFSALQAGMKGQKSTLWRIEQDIRDGLFSMSKASLDYRAEGIEFNLPVERFEDYGNPSAVENTTTFQPSKPAEAVTQEATTSDNQVVDAVTGETVRTETPIVPQEEQKPTKSSTDESTTKPRERRRRRVKGAKYEGNYQSLGEDRIYTSGGKKIAPMKFRNYLKSKGITEEHWNRMSSDEKQNEIDCC